MYLVVRKVYTGFSGALLGNGFDEQAGSANEVLVVEGKSTLVLGVLDKMRAVLTVQYRPLCQSYIWQWTYRTMGIPFTVASWKAVYHTGKSVYRKRIASLIMDLYGSSRRYGSRRLVSMCACARKKGLKMPTWYQRTSISGSGLPKKPPTSAMTQR